MAVSITSNHNKDLGSGQTGNLAHNRRDFSPHNVDLKLVQNNVVFKKRTLSEVYDEAFGDAIDDYNKKQKRSDRKKYDQKSYFRHLFGVEPESESAQVIITSNARGKNEIKSFNEELFQVGDCNEFGHFMRDSEGNFIDKNGAPVKWNKTHNKYYDINGNEVKDGSALMPNPKSEIAKEILNAFYIGGRFKVCKRNGEPILERVENDTEEADLVIPSFEERNPNFHVICAVEHNDEWHGTPHIHIDYVPVGTGYVKGPEKQVGFERALSDMGFKNKNTAYVEWREKERQILKDICNCYGLETKTREEEQANNRGITYSTEVYSQAIRDGRADAQEIKKQAQQEAQNITESARQEAQDLQYEKGKLAEEKDRLQVDIEEKRSQIALLSDIAEKMPKKKMFSSDKFVMDKSQYESLIEAAETTRRLSKNTLTSDKDKEALKNERARLEKLNREAEKRIQQQAEQIARQKTQQAIADLNKARSEYEKLSKNLKAYIKYFAQKMLEKISPTFAKLDREEKKNRLDKAYSEVEHDQKAMEERSWE